MRNQDTFVPPHHPNWTGKSYRSSMEAFGSNLYLLNEPRRNEVYTAVAYAVVLGIFLAVPLIFF